MELQWPLILFTTFLCASAGLIAIQSFAALLGKGKKAQMPALIIAFVLMVVGGVSVFFHLQHADRIFNGFGHITSGITQELIAIVVLFVLMIVFFIQLRRNEAIAKWAAVLGLIVGLGVILVAGLSYMMPSRPAWNNPYQILSLFGLGLAFGAGIFAFLNGAEDEAGFNGWTNIATTVLGAGFAGAFLGAMKKAVASFVDVGQYFDPNHPTVAVTTAANFAPAAASGAVWAAIILAVLAVVCAIIGKLTGKWKIFGILIALLALGAAIALRVVFFTCGGSVFMLF